MATTLFKQLCAGRQRLNSFQRTLVRNGRTATTATAQKKEGDISDAFASLSGMQFGPLESRFAELKSRLILGHEDALHDSCNRLLTSLRDEIPIIAELKSKVIPEIDFNDIGNASPEFVSEHRKRGVAVIRNVIPQQEVNRGSEVFNVFLAFERPERIDIK